MRCLLWKVVPCFETSSQEKLCFLHKVMFSLKVRSSGFFSKSQLLILLLETFTRVLNGLQSRQ